MVTEVGDSGITAAPPAPGPVAIGCTSESDSVLGRLDIEMGFISFFFSVI